MVGRIDEEPPEIRALQLAAAEEIAAAQERLRLEAEQLEGPPQRRIAILQAVCEAQQAAKLQLTVIIKRHRPSTLLRANLDERLADIARQLEVSAAASRLADDREQLPANIHKPGDPWRHPSLGQLGSLYRRGCKRSHLGGLPLSVLDPRRYGYGIPSRRIRCEKRDAANRGNFTMMSASPGFVGLTLR